MDKKDMMRYFIENVCDKKLMTKFIKNIFGYEKFFDYNYMFRFINDGDSLIFDIYDNITDINFNRYIFNFDKCNYIYKEEFIDNLYIHYICILNLKDCDNNLDRFAYLFKLNNDEMISFAEIFLDNEFILILKDIIK